MLLLTDHFTNTLNAVTRQYSAQLIRLCHKSNFVYNIHSYVFFFKCLKLTHLVWWNRLITKRTVATMKRWVQTTQTTQTGRATASTGARALRVQKDAPTGVCLSRGLLPRSYRTDLFPPPHFHNRKRKKRRSPHTQIPCFFFWKWA